MQTMKINMRLQDDLISHIVQRFSGAEHRSWRSWNGTHPGWRQSSNLSPDYSMMKPSRFSGRRCRHPMGR